MLLLQDKLTEFILACQDEDTGGFSDRPGDWVRLVHCIHISSEVTSIMIVSSDRPGDWVRLVHCIHISSEVTSIMIVRVKGAQVQNEMQGVAFRSPRILR